MAEHWIQGAIRHPGALHREMGVPEGQPIQAQRLEHAADAGGVLGERARLAETLKGMHRAFGGPVEAGKPYVVGERGAELFQPHVGGRIVPHHQMVRQFIMAGLRGGGR